jgi:predicted TIM-barrel fold metal-dependent hydrolase
MRRIERMAVVKNRTVYRVADAHTHIYPERIAEKATNAIGVFYDFQMENIGLPDTLFALGNKAGIDKYLVSSVATKVEQVRSISVYIAETCRVNPAYIGLGAWHQDIRDIEGEFDRIQSLGLRGIKLHPDFQKFNIDEPRMLDVYREANRRKLPVLFHTGDDRTDFSSPIRLARVIDRIPDFTCVAAHLGGYRQWSTAIRVLRGANVYVDTSSSLPYLTKEDALLSIAHFGVHRTLFGSDFPMWTPETELERFFGLGLTEEENRRILYGNFAELFGEPCV